MTAPRGKKTRVLNLYGGPGSGKSTAAAGTFFLMKANRIECELVQEYAKDKTYEENWSTLSDQFYVIAKQSHRLQRLLGRVDWIITDSPLPLGIMFAQGPFKEPWFEDAIMSLYDTYENIDVRIDRVKVYERYGRSQTEEEARAIDARIDDLMRNAYDLHVAGDMSAPQRIFDFIKSLPV
jgi:hypothetical protein